MREIRENTSIYKKWKKDVLSRDSYMCQWCHNKEDLVAHHIVSWKENIELRFNLSNGLTLCRSCHMSHHKNKKGKSQVPWNKGIKTGKGGPRGQKFTEAHKLKLKLKKIGFIFTDEHRKKLRDAKTPENIEANKIRYKGKTWAIDKETGKRIWIDK